MNWVNSSDLKNWPEKDSRSCQHNLPLLLRLLIIETGTGFVTRRIFQSGDAVQYSGPDGIVETNNATTHIPEGLSVWECGSDKVIKPKADKDYKKDLENPVGYVPNDCTFVFVTPRIWNHKQKQTWMDKKKADKVWKDVRVYDARDLEEWLEEAPVTAATFAKRIFGKYPLGVEPLEDFWNGWIISPQYTFNSSIILAGREKEIESIRKWLDGPPTSFVLKALTKEEALAFLCASILNFDLEKKEKFFSRSLVLRRIDEFNDLINRHKNLIVVNYFNDYSAVDLAVAKEHHVFVPVGPDVTAIDANAELGVLDYNGLVNTLKKDLRDRAEHYSKESGRSLSVLRRLLLGKMGQPEWAKKKNANDIIPLLLAGRWDSTQIRDNDTKVERPKYADREVIALLANTTYEDYLSKLTEYKNDEDPPLYEIGRKWRLVSPLDAWLSLAQFITEVQLEKFRKIASEVISEDDPEYNLDEDQRYKAEILGAIPKYSEWLTEGILQTLILIALYGKRISLLGDEIKAQQWVDSIVRELLNDAEEKRWFSVSTVLPQLAEASPDSFLSCVDESLDSKEQRIKILFREGKDILFSSCNHSGLLWALESLAWKGEYINKVTTILAKLCKLDPGGRWANRPMASLRAIFLAWLPYTMADLNERLEAMDSLIEDEKLRDVAFELLMDLMPKHGDISNPTFKPRWRWFSEIKERRVTYDEMYQAYSEFLKRAIKMVGNNGRLIARIVPCYDEFGFSREDLDMIYNHIDSHLNEIVIGKKELWNALRKLISRHRTYSDAKWAMPSIEVDKLQKLYEKIEINDVDLQYKWLFDDHYPELFDANRREHDEFEKAVETARINAVKEIVRRDGEDKIIEMVSNVNFPYFLGFALAKSSIIKEDFELKVIGVSAMNEKLINFSRGFYDGMRRINTDWVSEKIKLFQNSTYNKDIVINFFTTLDFNRDTWNLLTQFSADIERGYWSKSYIWLHDMVKEDKEFVVRKVLGAKRFLTLMEAVSYNSQDIAPELIAEILEKGITTKSDELYKEHIDPHNAASLFKALDKSNYDDSKNFVKLEWLYIEILSDDLWGRPPKLLHKDLSEHPESFVQLIRWIYKPKDDEEMSKEETKGLSEKQIERRFKAAYDLLGSFKTIPGIDENGKIDKDILLEWVYKVINLSRDAKREYHGYYYIGELFAKGINWLKPPPNEICEVIEKIKNKDLEQGFSIATFNRRGGFSKGLWEGGTQEMDLAKNFSKISKGLKLEKYLRTSELYARIAKSYEFDAKREDDRAKEMNAEY